MLLRSRHFSLLFLLLLLFFFSPEIFARDLVGSVTTIKSYLTTIAGAASGIAVLVGAVLFSIGVAEWGKRLLVSGAIGAFLVGAWTGIEAMMRSFG